MSIENTEAAQNIIARLLNEIKLNVCSPTSGMKIKFSAIKQNLEKVRCQLDILNDMIEEGGK